MSRRVPNYDKYPEVKVKGFGGAAFRGWSAITSKIASDLAERRMAREMNKRGEVQKPLVLVIDCYPGVLIDEIKTRLIENLYPSLVINIEDAKLPESVIYPMIKRNLTDDRVFGVLSCHRIEEFFDNEKLNQIKAKIKAETKTAGGEENGEDSSDSSGEKLVVVYGPGASLVSSAGDVKVYADLARWEIQRRYRAGLIGNWGLENYKEDVLRRYKRGFFVEWRVFDRHKVPLLRNSIDYLLDTNVTGDPKMVTRAALLQGLRQTVQTPFRVVPFFDPGVWGGQWMKRNIDLDQSARNYAWCFDCVPEENSLFLRFNPEVRVEIPSINLVLLHPVELLGEKVYGRFGTEFPIRFDFLDTIEGQNLSCQVHPVTEYIQQQFGMHYTQDESYYILDSDPTGDSCVYLGVKTGINPQEMIEDLKRAEKGEKAFDDDKFINKFPAKTHDHFLIPAGTVHCSGKGTMVLEISATPYIFTFKLWDWGRLGLDGLPRPVHIEHGSKVIDFTRDTEWVKSNLINRVEVVAKGDGWREERTGLHEREFIETRRHWFTVPIVHDTEGRVNVLNLVSGNSVLVDSPEGRFEPYVIHYAETFIVPAAIGKYRISPIYNNIAHYKEGLNDRDGSCSSNNNNKEQFGTIKAWVRCCSWKGCHL